VTIKVSTTEKRDGKALALFARHETWMRGHTKDGRSFFAIPGSEPDLFHMADHRDCSCPDRRYRALACSHMRAVRFWMAAYMTGAVSPKREAGATGQDDRVALTPKGAAYLAAVDDERNDVIEDSAEHPHVQQLRTMLARETCQEGRQAIAAKLDDTKAKIVATARRKSTYDELMD
jgi:hypothetical protein